MKGATAKHRRAEHAGMPSWRRYVPYAAVSLLFHAWLLWGWCDQLVPTHRTLAAIPVRIAIAAVHVGGGRQYDAGGNTEPARELEPRQEGAPAEQVARVATKPKKVAPRTVRHAKRQEASVPMPLEPALPTQDKGAAVGLTGNDTGQTKGYAVRSNVPGSSGVGAAGRGSGEGPADFGNARAYCLSCPAPAYPLIARQRNWSGTVAVWLEVNRDGAVGQARVERSSGYEVLDREALTAARRSRFRLPEGNRDGAAGIIEYRFELVE